MITVIEECVIVIKKEEMKNNALVRLTTQEYHLSFTTTKCDLHLH